MNYSAKTVYREDAVAGAYERTRFQTWRGRIVDALEKQRMLSGMRHLGVSPAATVLDVPAGTGRLTRWVVDSGHRAVGIDVSVPMLHQGFLLHALNQSGLFVGAAAGDIENLPLRSRSVDVVLCLRLMGHLPPDAKERALREMLRVARIGAVVMFAHRTLLLRAKREMLWRLRRRPRAVHWFDETEADTRALVTRAGGAIVAHEDLLWPVAESRAYVIRSL